MAALREINVLLDLAHANIVRVSEMVMGGNASKIFMVMEYMECDLKQAVGGKMESWGDRCVLCWYESGRNLPCRSFDFSFVPPPSLSSPLF